MASEPRNSESQLLRVLGPVGATTVVIGSVIGSGIFLKANVIAQAVGRFDLVLAVWVGCGLISLLGALSSAELGAMLPQAGGPYVYLRAAFGPLTAFLWGWIEFWVARTGSTAALAYVFTGRLAQLFESVNWMQQEWARKGIAVAVISLLVLINLVGARWGGHVQNITTYIKAGTLVALAILPFAVGHAEFSTLTTTAPIKGDFGSLWVGIGAAMGAVFWAYDGWGNIGPVAEEVKDPGRNMPIALIGGMFILIALYVSTTIAYQLVLPMGELQEIGGNGRKDFVAQVFCQRLLGDWGGTIAIAAVLCSTFGALNSNVLTGPRVIFAMARDGLFLSPMRRVHPVWRTPINAILGEMAWACVLVLFGDVLASGLGRFLERIAFGHYQFDPNKSPFDVLTDYVIFGSYIFYTLAVAAVLVLRAKQPNLPRPYRTWGYPWVPILFVASSVWFLISMFRADQVESIAGLVFIGLGAIAYQFRPRKTTGLS
jgi:APA family basic amino acid/polyamine antiporter